MKHTWDHIRPSKDHPVNTCTRCGLQRTTITFPSPRLAYFWPNTDTFLSRAPQCPQQTEQNDKNKKQD